jgi:putative DNA primase/helicase
MKTPDAKVIALIQRVDDEIEPNVDTAVADDADLQPAPFSDSLLASVFAERHVHEFRYVELFGRWLFWDGCRWQRDETGLVWSKVRRICDEASACHPKPQTAKALASERTISAVERVVRRDRRLVASVGQWDANPWLLNTPSGIVDLKSGKLHPHDPTAHCTKMTAVAAGGECPQWQAFLDRITNGNRELQQFLQRMFGYALTGITSEHAMFFLYGTGANGKSVAINTVSSILADYQKTAPIETFTASIAERHPTDVAGLQGARLVTAIETEEGKRWAESKIKAMTGGDPIAARFMRQDFFEFTPQFKLIIAGNHKPGLSTVDEAMRRRLHLVPFAVTIPAQERDPQLTEKLESEWSGILQWMIDGCLQWQRLGGLQAPAAVAGATAEYMSAEDDIATWIEERCEEDPQAEAGSSELYQSWENWTSQTGRAGGAGSQKAFSQKLLDRGFKQRRKSSGQVFIGLRVRGPMHGATAALQTLRQAG